MPLSRKVIVEEKVHIALDKLEQNAKDLLWERFDALTTDPFSGTRLFGIYKGMYITEVFPFKVIYKIVENKNAVVVLELYRQTVVRVD